MAGLINLPGYNPGPGINFQPVQNALSQVNESAQFNRQNALMQRQMGMQEKQLGMQEQRFGMEKQQFEQEQKTAAMRRFAIQTAEIDKMTDPTQRKSAWDQHLATHPDTKSIPLNYWDPMNGPKMVLKEAEGFMGEKDRAQIGLIQANTAKALREASEAGGYGKDVKLFQDEFGRTWGVQAGSRGDLKFHNLSSPGSQPTTQPPPGFPRTAAPSGAAPSQPGNGPQQAQRPSLTPFRPRSVVGDRVFNPATGQFEGSAAEAIRGGEIAKGEGEHIVKLTETLPKSRASLESANAKVNVVMDNIAAARKEISAWSTGYGAVLDRWPATQARNLKGRIDTIIANLGFDELQDMRTNSPTGGALGQVAVQELDMLQKTRVALDRARSADEVKTALDELEVFYKGKPKIGPDDIPVVGADGKIVREGGAVERRQRAFDETYAPLRQRRTGNSHEVTGPRVPRQFGDRLPQGGAPQPGAQGMIPPQSVRLLQSDPSPQAIQEFEDRYGPGSARQFLGGQ